MVRPLRILSPPALAVLLFGLVSSPTAAQYDGALSPNFGAGDGFATWNWGGQVFLEAAVATPELLYGVGDYDFPAGTRSLHFQAVDRNGEIRGDRSCRDSTGAFGAFTDESGGETAILDSSGNLLIGGWMTFEGSPRLHALLARYEIDQTGCTLDESFSDDGFRLFDTQTYCNPESCLIVGLGEIRPETGAVSAPRIVALLRAAVAVSSYRYFLLGLTSGGSFDTTFGSGTSGIREVGLAGLGTLRSSAAMTVDEQGRILVLVTRLEPDTTSDLDTMALRYTAGGDLDTGFSGDGLVPIVDTGIDDTDDAVAQDLLALPSEGNYFAAAQNGTGGSWMVRVFPDEEISVNGLPNSTSPRFAAQGNGRFLVATEFVNFDAFRSWRNILTPTSYDLDATYSSGDYEMYDIDFGGGTGQEIVDFLLWGGRPILVGDAIDADIHRTGFLMRAENSYIFTDGFESGNRARWWGY